MSIIVKMKFGSHLYGTDTPESDTDYKAIYIPTAREIILGNYKKTIQQSRPKGTCERNTKDDIDVEIFSLDRYLELLMAGQTVALDILFGFKMTDVTSTGRPCSIMRDIWSKREQLLTRNVHAFVGYARQQAAKYGIKGSRLDALKKTVALLEDVLERGSKYTRLGDDWVVKELQALVQASSSLVSLEKTALIQIIDIKGPPSDPKPMPHLEVCGRKVPYHSTVHYALDIYTKILNEYGGRAQKAHLARGVDWKALSHAVRVNNEAIELLTKHGITFPRPDAPLLLEIKQGKLPYDTVAEMIEQGLADLTAAHEASTLREEPNRQWAEDFIYDVYSEVVRNGT